ncbi:hypothetical protein PG985_004888 [Apiospora marii]|uniref:uncharacterized protein n=1 Tax=Apiospora marii TaxID=335849 RepID=UPI00312DB392
MDPIGWYVIALGLSLLLFVLLHSIRITLVKRVRLPVCDWYEALSLAPKLFLACCIAANGLLLGYGSPTLAELSQRSAQAAAVNLVPVFLGGRTNALFDAAGFSLRAYELLRLSSFSLGAIEAFLHFALALVVRQASTDFIVSGSMIVVMLNVLAALLLSPMFPAVRRLRTSLRRIQQPVALLTLVALLWHVFMLPVPPRIAPMVSLAMWALLAVFRVARTLAAGRATLTSVQSHGPGLVWKVQGPRHARPYPGCYFYIYNAHSPTFHRFLGHPMLVYSWRALEPRTANESPAAKEAEAPGEMTFLVQSPGAAGQKRAGDVLFLDGPYGKDVHAELYETVVLAAQGIGIAGVLPCALYLAHLRKASKRRDAGAGFTGFLRGRLLTRQVVVLWKLEGREQESWVKDSLASLLELDPDRSLVQLRFYYPNTGATERCQEALEFPEHFSKHWKRHAHPDELHDEMSFKKMREFVETASRREGRSLLLGELPTRSPAPKTNPPLACGEDSFVRPLRHLVSQLDASMEFAPADFRPASRREVPLQDPRDGAKGKGRIKRGDIRHITGNRDAAWMV